MSNFKIIARTINIVIQPGDDISKAVQQLGPGGTLFLAQGAYIINENIELPENSHIVGLGGNTISGSILKNTAIDMQGNDIVVMNCLFQNSVIS